MASHSIFTSEKNSPLNLNPYKSCILAVKAVGFLQKPDHPWGDFSIYRDFLKWG
ncbi:hypothetical protein TOL_0787 [Thalassolituus oleivorans MIL-1]|uniref:Uncharacterized protein n=1 Tax=Thalassolituus oleivorans MIL-1 TaxID=1298593 RepID=M5DMT5_9GAMM|nr:hypothetical protein TOL_0787 [Thalassolituus oleivorans MIL-1]